MPIYSKQEFCELTELELKNLATYIGRGKVVLSGKMVDTSIQMNADFLAHRVEHLRLKSLGLANEHGMNYHRSKLKADLNILDESEDSKEIIKAGLSKIKGQKKTKKGQNKGPRYAEPDPFVIAQAGLKNRLEEAKLKKAMIDIDIAEFKREQMEGKFIPTDQVKAVFRQLGQTFATSYRNGFENILEEFVHKYKISHEDMVKLKQKTVAVINSSHEHAIKSTQRGLTKIIEEQTKRPEYEDDNQEQD